MRPEPYETIPAPKVPTPAERLALIASDLENARWHTGMIDGDWDTQAHLLRCLIDAQAAVRKLQR